MGKVKDFISELFSYAVSFDASSNSYIAQISFYVNGEEIKLQPFFEISTSHSKVVARSQIIDGEEIFERMSVKTTEITLNGRVLVKQWSQTDFSGLGRGLSQILTGTPDPALASRQYDLLQALSLVNRKIYKPNDIISVSNLYLNYLGITDVLIVSMNTSPLVGSVGFEFSIRALDATNKKDNVKESLIISQ